MENKMGLMTNWEDSGEENYFDAFSGEQNQLKHAMDTVTEGVEMVFKEFYSDVEEMLKIRLTNEDNEWLKNNKSKIDVYPENKLREKREMFLWNKHYEVSRQCYDENTAQFTTELAPYINFYKKWFIDIDEPGKVFAFDFVGDRSLPGIDTDWKERPVRGYVIRINAEIPKFYDDNGTSHMVRTMPDNWDRIRGNMLNNTGLYISYLEMLDERYLYYESYSSIPVPHIDNLRVHGLNSWNGQYLTTTDVSDIKIGNTEYFLDHHNLLYEVPDNLDDWRKSDLTNCPEDQWLKWQNDLKKTREELKEFTLANIIDHINKFSTYKNENLKSYEQMEAEKKKGNRLTAMKIDGKRSYKNIKTADSPESMDESYTGGMLFKPGYKNKFKFVSEKYLAESFDNNEFEKDDDENYFDSFSKENTEFRIVNKIQDWLKSNNVYIYCPGVADDWFALNWINCPIVKEWDNIYEDEWGNKSGGTSCNQWDNINDLKKILTPDYQISIGKFIDCINIMGKPALDKFFNDSGRLSCWTRRIPQSSHTIQQYQYTMYGENHVIIAICCLPQQTHSDEERMHFIPDFIKFKTDDIKANTVYDAYGHTKQAEWVVDVIINQDLSEVYLKPDDEYREDLGNELYNIDPSDSQNYRYTEAWLWKHQDGCYQNIARYGEWPQPAKTTPNGLSALRYYVDTAWMHENGGSIDPLIYMDKAFDNQKPNLNW